MAVELFTTRTCPYCAQAREQLDWDGTEYVEHDVEAEAGAHARLIELAGPIAIVPVLVEDGRVTQVGVDGRGCYVGAR
jgi:glutaredoxin